MEIELVNLLNEAMHLYIGTKEKTAKEVQNNEKAVKAIVESILTALTFTLSNS